MVQTLEAIKGGGGSIKVGTTGTISALMSRELQSVKDASANPAPSSSKTSKTANLEPNDATTGASLKTKVQADEASTSCSSSSNNNINEKHTDISRKTKHHTRKASQNPILNSDSMSIDETPRKRKHEKKGSYIVEVVDIKCGMPDKTWANPITTRLKKLSFSKLSDTNGVN